MTLDLDGLYRGPGSSLIGTKPANVTWSPDAQSVAFTWNDAGGQTRDLWTWNTSAQELNRLTRHGEDEQTKGSVTDVAWLAGPEAGWVYAMDDGLHQLSSDGSSRHIVEVAGLRQLTSSPNHQALAYVTSEGLFVLSALKSKPRRLVALEDPALRPGSLQWSTDGQRIAFLLTDYRPLPQRAIHYYTRDGHQEMTVRRAFPGEPTSLYQVGVVDVSSGMLRYLPRPDESHYVWGFGLDAAGERVFINSSDLLVKHHQIRVYDLASGSNELVYQEHDPNHLRPDWQVAWAPDGEGLLILTDHEGYSHLYRQPKPGASLQPLTAGDWEVAKFWANADADWIYFLANRSHLADKQLFRVRVSGGEIERATQGHGTHAPFFSPDLAQAVTLFSDDNTPHDLYSLDIAGGATTQITSSPQPDFYQQSWADVRYIEFPSRVDGVNLVGRLSLPPDFDPEQQYPLIVGSVYSDSVLNQWGGRQSHPTWGLDQYLVARGYLLLNVNVRGSWGQGRAHNQGLRHGYGIVDIEDLHSGVEHLISEGYVDPKRVGIWGSSYGGLMTMMSLFKKPGVYAAGIAGAPATNVGHAYPGQRWVMGPESGEDQPARYQSQSPLYHSAGLEDPLMIIHGSRDQVVLYSDTIAVVQDLIDREQMFELVTLPGVGHGWDAEAPEVRRFAFKKMVRFFDRYLRVH